MLIPTGFIAYLLLPLIYSDARFQFTAVRESGKILAYGIQSEVIAGSSVNSGSWQKTHHSPWIDVESVSLAAPCHIEGQRSVFGNWLSDEKLIIHQTLERITKQGRIDYYVEKETKTCSVGKTIDMYAAVIFFLCLIISVVFFIWSCQTIYNRKPHDKYRINYKN